MKQGDNTTKVADSGQSVSARIRSRLQQEGLRFFANDHIADAIQDGEIDALIDEVAERMQGVLESLVIDTELLEIVQKPLTPADVAEAPADAKTTESGLAYKVLRAGIGAELVLTPAIEGMSGAVVPARAASSRIADDSSEPRSKCNRSPASERTPE